MAKAPRRLNAAGAPVICDQGSLKSPTKVEYFCDLIVEAEVTTMMMWSSWTGVERFSVGLTLMSGTVPV